MLLGKHSDPIGNIQKRWGISAKRLTKRPAKPIDRWLALLGIAAGIALVIFPKGPIVTVAECMAIFGCLIHPVLNLWWIEETRTRRVSASIMLALTCAAIGCVSWPPSGYIFVIPTDSLVDGNRLLFVRESGTKQFKNVTLAIQDNNTPMFLPLVERYTESVGANLDNPLAPRYIAIKPATPWKEEYTIVVTSDDAPALTEHLFVLSAGHKFRTAVEVISANERVLLRCLDSGIPRDFNVTIKSNRECGDKYKVAPNRENISPHPVLIMRPDGSADNVGNPVIPAPQFLDASDTRHLFDYQRAKITEATENTLGQSCEYLWLTVHMQGLTRMNFTT